MYTQCPACKVAFRVTPTTLQQAGGKVRCGSCGDAFNALDHLSDSAPRDAVPSVGAKLRRDSGQADSPGSAAESDGIRIEDTGVEWRVVDGGNESPPAAPNVEPDLPADAGHVATFVEELRFDDNTPLSEDFFHNDAEEPVYEPPRRRASDLEPPDLSGDNEDQEELDLSEPEDWVDVLAEVAEFEVPAEPDEEEMSAALEAIDPGDSADEDALELDDSEDVADDDVSAEDLSAALEALHVDGDELDDDIDLAGDEPDDDGALDDELSAAIDQLERTLEGGVVGATDQGEDVIEEPASAPEGNPVSMTDENAAAVDPDAEEADVPDTDEPADPDTDESADPGRDEADGAEESAEDDSVESDQGKRLEADILAMTANMEVDPEILMAMKDGYVDDGMVETVVMEGSSIEDFLQGEREDADENEAEIGPGLQVTDEPASLLDTYMLNRKKAGERGARGSGVMIVLIVILALGLIAQGVHSQRENLLTSDFLSSPLGGFYESIGSPVVPNWDARLWQFESTSGSSGEDLQLLTITTRISNRSDKAMPLPLIHVSLTDRYEEVVGSRVLEPREYMPRGTNPNRPVRAGEDFTAEVTFAAASPNATGFKLNVCYADAGGGIRCAIEDFR